jgi:hypothetical protein
MDQRIGQEDHMDASGFDRLTRSVGGHSRRSTLGTALAGATVAAAGLLASATGSGAKKKKRKKKCKKCRGKAQGERCLTNKECCANETHLACAFTSGVNQPVCCGVLGAPCGVAADCCRGFECSGGQCVFLM